VRADLSDGISRDLELLKYGLDPSLDSPLLPNAAVMNALQNLVRLATQLCDAPFGVVNIISAGHQHQIGAWGVEPGVCSREDSMCAKVFLSREVTVVADASRDPRFADNPFVTGAIGTVRFYASVPLETGSGFVPGTLCVFSETAQELSPGQVDMLVVLAKQVVELLELQHRTAQLDRTLAELKESNARLAAFAGRVSHDLRTPLTTMLGYLEMLQDTPGILAAPGAPADLEKIDASGRRMLGMLQDVLSYSRVGGGIQPEWVSIQSAAREVLWDLKIEDPEMVEVQDARVRADRSQLRSCCRTCCPTQSITAAPTATYKFGSRRRLTIRAPRFSWQTTARGLPPRIEQGPWNLWCGSIVRAMVREPALDWRRAEVSPRPTAGS